MSCWDRRWRQPVVVSTGTPGRGSHREGLRAVVATAGLIVATTVIRHGVPAWQDRRLLLLAGRGRGGASPAPRGGGPEALRRSSTARRRAVGPSNTAPVGIRARIVSRRWAGDARCHYGHLDNRSTYLRAATLSRPCSPQPRPRVLEGLSSAVELAPWRHLELTEACGPLAPIATCWPPAGSSRCSGPGQISSQRHEAGPR